MSDAPVENESNSRPFKIHTIDSYDNVGLQVMTDEIGLSPRETQDEIRGLHRRLVAHLATGGINYDKLGKALISNHPRREAAFLFDSTVVDNLWYGYEISKLWLAALQNVGPESTTIRHGDILTIDAEFLWRKLDDLLVRERDFPRLSPEQYHVIYLSNLSNQQLEKLHQHLLRAGDVYIGYIDCSVWNPVKTALLLPQFAVRNGQVLITEEIEGDGPNPVGYPIGDYGFTAFGVDEFTYGALLGHRFDNGVPDWADDDSALALKVLGGSGSPVSRMNVVITQSRLTYLGSGHGASLERAGLSKLTHEAIENEIRNKLANNLIFNLEYKEGSKDGVPDPSLDAMKFNIQMEFPDDSGVPRRFLASFKYYAATNTVELVTFF